MQPFIYKLKNKFLKLKKELKSKVIGNLIWEMTPETLIYNPVIDFTIIPKNFNLIKLTTNKVDNLMVEVGTGNGDFLSYIAQKEKLSLIIGFEVAKDYFVKTKNNISKDLRLNAKACHADAFEVMKDKFSDNSVSKLFINFPDPWPKKRQWKRRFLTEEKLQVILQKLKSNGEIIFVTDHMEYADFVENICKKLKENGKVNYEISNQVPSEYPETKYFKKWKKLGKLDYKTIIIQKA